MFTLRNLSPFHVGFSGSFADRYVSDLREHGYSEGSIRGYCQAAGHFTYWLVAESVQLRRVDDGVVQRFLSRHLLTGCDCPSPRARSVPTMRAALTHLLRLLRSEGHIQAGSSLVPSAIRAELDRFDAYLDEVCGLTASTRLSRRGWIRGFLCKEFGRARIQISALTPRAVEAFVANPSDRHAPGTAHAVGCALRSYLRFRASIGDQTEALVAAVPTVAQWRLAALPEYLSANEVDRFLKTFDRQSPSGQRGYAMVRCLLDLGLRASEVAHIRLDDLDWTAGTLRIAGAKGRRVELLPLPDRTGRALVAYLQGHRPRRPSPWLFVRHRAPLDLPVGPEIVRCTVRMAFARCGLDRYTGTHVLRRTAATHFLHAGASLKDIADVLRHRSLDTTTIYTKVDLPKLAAVATPWPGTQS